MLNRKLVIARTAPSVFLAFAVAAQGQILLNRTLPPNAVAPQSAPALQTPASAPCSVTLFSNYEFANFNAQYFTYSPICPGPWSKVTLQVSFNVSEGIQYDRTAEISMGYVNVFFGTTEEPSPTSAPAWTIERDLTDYSVLFTQPQSGEVDLGNLVNSTYTGVIYGTAQLLFYPVANPEQAPVTADAVYPMPDGPGGAVGLSSTSSQLAVTFTFPTNLEKLYLDVIAQSQSSDEFWYSCVPNDVSSELQSCSNTAFRETQVSIDGQPAGVAPIFPWIFTGGIDPYLWIPYPGVQTLNFQPFRVNLTPFAGALTDGNPHTVAISVYNANNYFQATGVLLAYLDHGSSQTSGAVTSNTLTAPSPAVNENLNTSNPNDIYGTVGVTSNHQYMLTGYVDTSHGRVTTSIFEDSNFANNQQFNISSSQYLQAISQSTRTQVTEAVESGSGTTYAQTVYSFPLTLVIDETLNSTGINQKTTIDQTNQSTSTSGKSLVEEVKTTDTLEFDLNFNLLGNMGQASSSQSTYSTPNNCKGVLYTAKNNATTGVKNGYGCP